MQNKDFPCKCGHSKKDHDVVTKFINDENYCRTCDLETSYTPSFMHWHKYVSDNLKYLEQLSESRD